MRRSASFVLSAAAIFLAFAGAANATQVTTDFCNGTPYSAENWSSGGGVNGGYTFADQCATGGGLQISTAAIMGGDLGGWYNYFGEETPVVSYSFDLDGGDTSGGLAYVASSCDECDPDETITTRAPGDPTLHVTVPAPHGSGEIYIYARCDLEPFCMPTVTPVQISNIRVTISDETPPTASGWIATGSDISGSFLGWTNKDAVPVSVYPVDQGVGVRRTSVDVAGAGQIFSRDFAGDCSFGSQIVYLPICPNSPSASGPGDLSFLSDGIHDLTFSAEDALGNSATSAPEQIGIDRIAPAPPASSTLAFTPSGWPGQRWTSDPKVVMNWPVEPAVGDPEFDSPFKNHDFSTHRDGSPTVTHTTLDLGSDHRNVTLPSDGMWDLAVRYLDEAGNLSEPTTKSIGIDSDAPFAPQNLNAIDWLSKGALGAKPRITWTAPEENADLESGVCGYVVSVDEFSDSNPVFGEDDSVIATSWPIPAGLPEGINFFHVRAVSCAGVASPTVTAEIRVDTEGPGLDVSGLATPGAWISVPQTGTISATDEQSGVAKVGYAIDGGGIAWTNGNHVNASVQEGEHQLTAYATDVAGNTSSIETVVRTDQHAPVVQLANSSVEDPTRVDASVVDSDSGLASAAIELRRVDSGAGAQEVQWQPLGSAESITRGTTGNVEISRTIDDARLAAGSYELRVNAVDIAGNSSVADAFASRSIQLPLRRRAELSAAVAQIKYVCRTKSGKACSSARKCARKSKCRTVRIVDRDHARTSVVQSWSQRAVLIGDALDSNGVPVAGAKVAVLAAPLLHDSESIGSAVTDANGHYELTLPSGPSRTVTAQLGGSSTQQPASAAATINVRSDIEFTPSRRNVRAGMTMQLRGRVLHPEWQPVGGLSVSFQWYSTGGWVTFSNPTPTDAKGRFSKPFKWDRSAKDSTILLRARIDKPAGWPFAPGSSDAVKVRVRAAK